MPQPDYENDLVFPPQEIKSQHELSEQGRQSDVLIYAIERCEKLEKEIIALKKEYQAECNRADELEDSLQTSWLNESKLKKQLKIAVKALEVYKESSIGNGSNSVTLENGLILEYNPEIAKKALEQIKELYK